MKINVDALKILIIKKRLSITQLAQLAGIAQVTVSSMLKNGESHHLETVGKVCKALNISPEEILLTE